MLLESMLNIFPQEEIQTITTHAKGFYNIVKEVYGPPNIYGILGATIGGLGMIYGLDRVVNQITNTDTFQRVKGKFNRCIENKQR